MRYCISDIHGEYELLIELMNKINFNENDTLYVLGDMIDKGNDSIKVVNFLFKKENCKCILGNHEYDFLKYYNSLMQQATDHTDYNVLLKQLQDYFPIDGYLLDWETIDKLDSLPSYFEFDNLILVHSGVTIDANKQMKPLRKTIVDEFVYNRVFKDINYPVCDKCIIFGHTPTRYMNQQDKFIYYNRDIIKENSLGNSYKILIDTGVYLSGVLGCLCIDDFSEYYVKKS